MKKITTLTMMLMILFALSACNQEVVTHTYQVSLTAEATNQLYVGDAYPDLKTWFLLEDEENQIVEITDDMITSTIPNENNLLTTEGVYDVIFLYVSNTDQRYSESISVTVLPSDYVEGFDFTHYMSDGPSFYTYGESYMSIDYETIDHKTNLVVDVIAPSTVDWYAYVGYQGFEFKSQNRYTFTIVAKTDVTNGRDIGVAFEDNNHNRLSDDLFTLNEDYQTYTGSFLASSDLYGGKLNIFLGNISESQLGKVYIQSIKVVESSEVIHDDNEGSLSWIAPNLDQMDSFVYQKMSTMTLAEKVGQMIQGERGSVTPDDVKNYNLGSVLNAGGSIPGDAVSDWYNMYLLYQLGAQNSSSEIPMIFGTDSVHGNNNLLDATLFPHNIGLGAANNPELMQSIGQVVAEETRLTGISWTFAPSVSVVQDARWGRTYESFSENTALVTGLTKSYVEGLQSHGLAATAKHYIGDGGTTGGIDQGDVNMTEAQIRSLFLAPYLEAIDADVQTIMISYSSILGAKMHGNTYWIQDVLKDELGFNGFIISDYNAIHQLPGSYYDQVVQSVNAGVDMLMEPSDWKNAYNSILQAVSQGDILESRIDDAVYRILTVKYKNGLFDNDLFRYKPELLANQEHLDIARQAVRESLVLLKNENQSLPLTKTENIAIVGPGADNFGLQLGGWSLGWQGVVDPSSNDALGASQYEKEVRSTTIKEGFEEALANTSGSLVSNTNYADTVIVVFAETPYAEGYGDDPSLDIIRGRNAHPDNASALTIAENAHNDGKNVVGILLSGRPLLINSVLPYFDSFVAAWLPGSEAGHGIADVLLGDFDFTGKTPFVWYMNASQFGTNSNTSGYKEEDYLFPFGFGLSYQ